MKLIIAEKPSLARAIAEGLGGGQKNGQLEGGGYIITNVFGHVLEQAEPDEYLKILPGAPRDENGKYKSQWRWEDLPIIPQTWIKKPVEKASDQLKKIGAYLKKAELVVHAGDPDREGQLLIDEVLDYFHYTGLTQRVWLASMDAESVKKAFSQLKNNNEYHNLSTSAECRSRADWLIGMNLSRAWSIRNRVTLSVGRVQTPTLALVVQRDLEIESFKPKAYYEVVAQIAVESGTFKAKWQPTEEDFENPAFDSENRLVDKAFAENIAQTGKSALKGVIAEHQQQDKSSLAPAPYSLSAIQKTASSRWGMNAKLVLDVCQSLYEKKLTTYPRTDCRYLPEEQFSAAGDIIEKLQHLAFVKKMTEGTELNPKRKHSAWNTAKITAHHGMMPTGVLPNSQTTLSDQEQKIYQLVCQSYLALFAPPEKYKSTRVVVHLGVSPQSGQPLSWVATGKRVVDPGWKRLFGAGEADDGDGEEEGNAQIPPMNKDDPARCQDASTIGKETRPPARFTDGGLIDAMSNIHKFVSDPEARAKLKENAGIGTEATRADIIETLKDKKFIEAKGKQLISTPLARSFIAKMNKDIKDPVTTARWETVLQGVSEGKVDMQKFMTAIEKQVIASLENVPCDVVPNQQVEECPICHSPYTVIRRESARKKGVFYWLCDHPEKPHAPLSDKEGRPGEPYGEKSDGKSDGNDAQNDGPTCPKCKKKTRSFLTKNQKPYYKCFACSKAWWPGDPENGSATLGTEWPKK